MYTEKVMDHFQNPRNGGEIENASGVGTVGNAKCGDIMRIYLDIDENQIIQDVKFKTFGCGAAVAISSMATELVKGKSIYEALKVTNKAVMEALDGLPPVKVHCSLLAEEAIHAALWDYAEKNGLQIEGLEKPKSDIHEDEEEDHSTEEADEPMSHAAAHSNVPDTHEEETHDEAAEDHDHSYGDVCAILIRSKSFNNYYKLMEVYGANASLLCINPSTVLREVLEQVDLSTQIVYILCAIILLMNIVVISVITLLNMYDAQKEIALMRLIGISMRKIGQLYLIQNGIIGLVSTILALILSQPLGTYWT